MKLRMLLIGMSVFLASAAYAIDPPDKDKPKKDERKLEVDNPVRKVSGMMKGSADSLGKVEAPAAVGTEPKKTPVEKIDGVKEEQKKILEELDKLIKMAQKSQSSSSSQKKQQKKKDQSEKSQQPRNSGSAGSSPMSDERDVFRTVKQGRGRGAPDVKEMWGKLPDASREEIQQLPLEKLPMKYQKLLYRYFKALSEQK